MVWCGERKGSWRMRGVSDGTLRGIGHRVDAGDVQRLGRHHAREDGGEGTRQQRLAGDQREGRAGHQDVVAASRGHFQRPLDHFLTPDAYTITPVTHLLSLDPGVTLSRSDGRATYLGVASTWAASACPNPLLLDQKPIPSGLVCRTSRAPVQRDCPDAVPELYHGRRMVDESWGLADEQHNRFNT